MALTDIAGSATKFVTGHHTNLLTKLGTAASKTGILGKVAGFLAKGAKFLGPWGTALTVATLAYQGISALRNRHPAAQRA